MASCFFQKQEANKWKNKEKISSKFENCRKKVAKLQNTIDNQRDKVYYNTLHNRRIGFYG